MAMFGKNRSDTVFEKLRLPGGKLPRSHQRSGKQRSQCAKDCDNSIHVNHPPEDDDIRTDSLQSPAADIGRVSAFPAAQNDLPDAGDTPNLHAR